MTFQKLRECVRRNPNTRKKSAPGYKRGIQWSEKPLSISCSKSTCFNHLTILISDGWSLLLLGVIPRMEHEQAFVSAFVVPEKRARYAAFLPNPKRRSEITNRFCHFFDFVPALARQVPRGMGAELAPLLRAKDAGEVAHVIGGRREIDGQDLPLEEAIDSALAGPWGAVVSCIPGKLALFIKEFPPGETFILSLKP